MTTNNYLQAIYDAITRIEALFPNSSAEERSLLNEIRQCTNKLVQAIANASLNARLTDVDGKIKLELNTSPVVRSAQEAGDALERVKNLYLGGEA